MPMESELSVRTSTVRPVKVSEMLRVLADDGWVIKRPAGSHRQLVHPTKSGKVTVAGRPSVTLPKGTEASILRQAGLRPRSLRDGQQTGKDET
jgi:predicted RNA binding protein YcfA (HicA-like mRNA interferase family)